MKPDEKSAQAQIAPGPTVVRIPPQPGDSTALQVQRRLAEALEQYAAVSEILQVISVSPNDVQPVLNAVAERAARLCEAPLARVLLVDGDVLRAAAEYSLDGTSQARTAPLALRRSTITGRAVLDRTTIHHGDVVPLLETEYPDALNARTLGLRAVLAVPLIREGNAYGAILLFRREPRPFSTAQVELVQTFAQQAMIAVNNVRLFNETREALDQQRASGEVLAAISESIADTSPVFERILTSCERLFTGNAVGINLVGDDGLIRLGAYRGLGQDQLERILEGGTGPGSAIRECRVINLCDVEHDPHASERTRRACAAIGVKAVIFAPMLWEGEGIGTIFVGRGFAGPFSEKEIGLLKTFAEQAAIAIQNARLLHEIEAKSRQLEIASQHKSEFLANMSHELRTPLNAIIGFSEVLAEKMFGEINDKQAEYLTDILESGRHLLSLINDILDLSKVEAGRMELEPTDFELSAAVESTLVLVRERAHRRGIALQRVVDERVQMINADERKVKQVLLNLLSNGLKFTPEGGQITVRVDLRDGEAEISVTDTGVGIAPEDKDAVFEEFRQVGAPARKVEGTGLGLAISRKFIELHGGRIWVTSEVGTGSTFTFTLPLRRNGRDEQALEERYETRH
jgi:signal transduction histidine kinase